jgi:hypothetical protein
MEIILDKKHTLKSDSMNIWVTRKESHKKKDGTMTKEIDEEISGYHATLDHLLNSLRLRKIRGVDTTKIEELNKQVHLSDALIVKFSKTIDDFVKGAK